MNIALAIDNTGEPRGTIAPLKNLTLLRQLVQKSLDRQADLPGLVTFSGPSGFGKSVAAAGVAGQLRAYYVEARSTWTKRTLMQAILKQMGIAHGSTVSEMVDQAGEQLALSRRPLLLDEADHIVQRGLIELVRDIYEQSQGTICLIGEELLPQKLRKYERVHGRMLDWAQAQPCDLSDARGLAKLYCGGVDVADDLLSHLVNLNHGSTRRVRVNIERIACHARSAGLKRITRADWGERELFTGEPPKPRGV